jgi:hypothetical protein
LTKAVVALLGGGFVIHAWWLRCVAEDAFITYRFARNVAEGNGFVWNIGEPPVEGFTNFLWVVISAALYRLGVDVPHAMQALGVLSGGGTLILCWHLARNSLRCGRAAALFTMAALVAAGPLAAWASSGMETVFFTFCIAAAVHFAVRFAATKRTTDGFCMAGSLLAASITRPEGFGLAVILFAATWLFGSADMPRARMAAVAATFGVLFTLYFVWRYVQFGHLLPNTFYAKTGGGIQQVWRGFVYVGYFALHFLLPWTPLLLLGAWEQTGGHRRQPVRIANDVAARPAAIVAAAASAYIGYVVLVGGDYMAMYRFMVPVLPLLYVLLGLAVDRTLAGVSLAPARAMVLAAAGAVTIAAVLVQSTPLEQALFADTPRMHGTYRGVGIERWHVNRFHVIADFFKTLDPTESSSILTWDIGVVGYRTRFVVLDALGIVDPHIAHAPPPPAMGVGLAGHEKQDLAYSYSKAPTFVMYTVQFRPEPAAWPRYPEDVDRLVKARYDLKSAWLVDALNGEAGYFTYLQRKLGPASIDR